MSLFGRLMDSMRVNSDEEDDEYFEEEEEYTEKPQKRLPSLIRKRDEEEEEEESKPRLFSRKVAPVKKSGSLEVALVKPSVFDDAKTIVDDLLYGKAVVLNMEGINTEVAQRIIDFTSGATYSMNGKLQKISNYIFIITPESVSLSGEFQDLLNSAGTLDISGLNMRV
ncbi:MAG: cell division protein SepF [Stomatobaculum sp.]|jgi:cell division inhibitor SepF|nr:cell division protein SepF [Stomatobaculum sp.]MBR7058231.1 cell division protein SepF [Stomatobaculum sp.]